MYNTESRISRLYYTYQHETIIIQYHEQIAPITTVTTTGIELKGEIEGTNQFEDEKRTNTKGKKRRTGTQSLNTGIHKEGEEGDLLCIVVPYPTRYCTYAVPTDRQQLQQSQQY